VIQRWRYNDSTIGWTTRKLCLGSVQGQWATTRKVASSIPVGMFHWHPSAHTVALGSTRVSGVSLGGKDGRFVGLTTLPPSCTDCLEVLGVLTSWIPKTLSKPVYGYLSSVRRTRDFSLLPSYINRIWGAPRFLFLWFRRFFSGVWTWYHLLLRLRMIKALPQLPFLLHTVQKADSTST
jgi:hypothetical protein